MNDTNNFFGYLITLILGVAGAKFWEYFFKYKGQVNVIQQQNLEILITKVYGGLIEEFKASHIKNETKIAALEIKIDKQGLKIENLDRKIIIYESHLSVGSERDQDLVRKTNLQLTPNPI